MGHRSKHEIYGLSRSQWEQLIDEWVFNERDRKILKRRLLDGITFEKLAEEFGMSVQQTKTVVYVAQSKLFKRI
jgi:DNA-directed RNA polymerase sigma subunit (sigma70/sigma32)